MQVQARTAAMPVCMSRLRTGRPARLLPPWRRTLHGVSFFGISFTATVGADNLSHRFFLTLFEQNSPKFKRLHPSKESRQNNLSNLSSLTFAASSTSNGWCIGYYGALPKTFLREMSQTELETQKNANGAF